MKSETETKVVRKGNRVDVSMSTIRSHFAPDNIEGIKVGDEVYFHVTNLEQDWDVPHGFAIKGAINSELLIMPGETNGQFSRRSRSVLLDSQFKSSRCSEIRPIS